MNKTRTVGSLLLQTHLAKSGASRESLCDAIGCSPQAVSYWVNGKRVPGIASALAIQRATDGDVPVESWTTEVRV